MENVYYVTNEGLKKLYEEIGMQDILHDEVEKEMGKSVKRDNDLRENPEYMELRVKAMYGIPQKKKELINKYNNAVVIEETDEYKNWDGATIIRKCKIAINYDGEIENYTILGSNEGNIFEGILSCESPLVKELLGKKVGDKITFNGAPITILEIKPVIYDKEKIKTLNENNK